jgi:uncharacterized LabA/DUF88 family protein
MASNMNRLSIFVDGNNMFYAQQKNGWFFDPRRVLQHFTSDKETVLMNAFWYTGIKDHQDQRGFPKYSRNITTIRRGAIRRKPISISRL